MTKHIHIVTLQHENFIPHYLISRLAEWWREQGHRITVGPSLRLEADIGIMHVDRTVVPAQCLPDNPFERPLLNATVLDISKRHISSNLVGPDSGYTGPVIVKTNANFFGLPERHAERAAGRASMSTWTRMYYRRLLEYTSRQRTRKFMGKNYPVLTRLDCVPEWVWEKEDLVVERFLPEIEKDEYALRIWLFFGDQEYSVRMFSRNPVVKAARMTRYEYISGVPDALREVRKKLGMDFGKFDYVLVNGEAVLLDVNKTPTIATTRSPTSNLPRLASGLLSYFEGRG